ncbi:MAG: 3'-5' exonuclease [Phycisphaerae bacterium]|nr:3'-5' exonuclease [Phycisphaerae bacterium]
MSNDTSGIVNASVYETPVAVIDFETTGLNAGLDRILEVAVVRIDPGNEPQLVFDTLVNPKRPVAATEIHGITDDDVEHAPTFSEIAGDFVRSISGCVVAAYNVYFDIRFLDYELRETGLDKLPPHLCLMYLRPMLGLGKRCPLHEACCMYDISIAHAHAASEDAKASAGLMKVYLNEMKKRNVNTFGDLARLKQYKFMNSFQYNPLSYSLVDNYDRCQNLKPRFEREVAAPMEVEIPVAPTPPTFVNPLAEYWDALKVALADLTITDEEVKELQQKKESLGLENEQIRMLHARLFSGVISQFINDKRLDDRECKILHRIYYCLSQLGWAPGEK